MSGKMEVWLLDLGTLYAKQEGIICRGWPQDTSRIHLPVMAVLVRHSGGILLFDTGCRPDAMTGGWPANMREAFPLTRTSEQALTHQLSLCGISPSQVDTVVLSHLHLDHAGNAGLFPHARLIVPAEDLEYARRLIENADPARRGGYIREDIRELPGKMTALVQDRQLFPGIRLLGLPGHTPALLGMEIAARGKILLQIPSPAKPGADPAAGGPARRAGDFFSRYRPLAAASPRAHPCAVRIKLCVFDCFQAANMLYSNL